MNWVGALFGASAVLAALAGGAAAFAPRPRHAAGALALAMLGIAGVVLTIGYDFLAIAIVALLAGAVPAAALAAMRTEGTEATDARGRDVDPGVRPVMVAVVSGIAVSGAVAGLLWRTTDWVSPGGVRQVEAVWLGWSLLSTDLATFLAIGLLLAIAGIGAVLVLRSDT